MAAVDTTGTDFVTIQAPQNEIPIPDALSAAEVERYKSEGMSKDDIQRKRDQVKQDIELVVERFTIPRQFSVHAEHSGELNIVVFGRQADGKSTVADLLLEHYDKLANVDFQGFALPQIGEGFKYSEAYVGDRFIRVLDLDGRLKAYQARNKLVEVFPKGVHALLYVWHVGKSRFAMDDQTFLEDYKDVFESGISEYCVTVLTSAYQRSPFRQQSISEFQMSQQGPGAGPLERFMFGQIDGRVLALELGDEPHYFAYRQRQLLMQIIDDMLAKRGYCSFVPQVSCGRKTWEIITAAPSAAYAMLSSWGT